MVDAIQRQVDCINKTNFRCQNSKVMAYINAKDSQTANKLAMAKFMSKFLAMQIA